MKNLTLVDSYGYQLCNVLLFLLSQTNQICKETLMESNLLRYNVCQSCVTLSQDKIQGLVL